MSLKTNLIARAAERLTSAVAEAKRRKWAEQARIAAGEPHTVDVFIDPADPYTRLLLQLLPLFAARYAVTVQPWLVSPPEDAAAPERLRLTNWSLRDAALLADRAGLHFAHGTAQPEPPRVATSERLIAGVIDHPSALLAISDILTSLWTGADWPHYPDADPAPLRAAGDARRTACGHYLGGTLHYGGETYWGIDRLHYLEARLGALGLRHAAQPAPLYPPPPDSAGSAPATGQTIHWYLSFRSPYTWLAAERVAALAAVHDATVEPRFVLPMMMRSLPVPREKRRYISLDAAREARRLGIAFGRIADPIGSPVERGYSLLPWARSEGCGMAFAAEFLRAVWSQGVDAGGDRGMRRIVEAAGLDWTSARTIIGNDDWRAEAEANRTELLDLGLWGAPSFRVGDFAVWGQDRLWMIDAALRQQR
jgi:2-hydroxychromene-2-carboxylate isomerase